MLLGDILKKFSDQNAAIEYLLALGDLPLAARVQNLATLEGEPVGEFVAATVQRYASLASDEEWLTLLGLISRAKDPAAAYLRRALEKSLTPG